MNYTEEILETEKKLNELKAKKHKFQEILKNLKVGDVVYEEESRFLDSDYHPQIIEEIDVDNCKVLTYEKSIDCKKWVDHFYLYDKETKKFNFYY